MYVKGNLLFIKFWLQSPLFPKNQNKCSQQPLPYHLPNNQNEIVGITLTFYNMWFHFRVVLFQQEYVHKFKRWLINVGGLHLLAELYTGR